jgi:hypothetical protein
MVPAPQHGLKHTVNNISTKLKTMKNMDDILMDFGFFQIAGVITHL